VSPCLQVQQQQQDWAALQQQVAPYLPAAGLSTQQLHWALAITRSRTFAAPYSSNPFGAQMGWLNKQAAQQHQQQHVMCPLLDLFNHRGDVQVWFCQQTHWLCHTASLRGALRGMDS
jgi:hypothetical protein